MVLLSFLLDFLPILELLIKVLLIKKVCNGLMIEHWSINRAEQYELSKCLLSSPLSTGKSM